MADPLSTTRAEVADAARPKVWSLRRFRVLTSILGLFACGNIFLAPMLRADRASVGEYQVKAAFLYNFAKFVEWPVASVGNTIVIGVLGDDPFGPVLDFTFEGKTVAGKEFEVRRFQRIDQLQLCQVLFISDSEQENLSRILGALRDIPVLTVSDARNFVKAGGIIELVLEDKKIRFDINLTEARSSRLRISAPLLQLARKVEGK